MNGHRLLEKEFYFAKYDKYEIHVIWQEDAAEKCE